MEKEYVLGEVNHREARLTWVLEDGNFSMSANLGNIMAGQCVNEVVSHFPDDKKAQRMKEIWQEWHLNHITAGSPAQREYLKEHQVKGLDHYKTACRALKEAGLQPDPNYLHNGKPYYYGTAWLKREIPSEIIKEIESW